MGAVKCLVTSILQNIVFCCREIIVRENLDFNLIQIQIFPNNNLSTTKDDILKNAGNQTFDGTH